MFSSGIKSQGAGTLYYDSGALKSFFEDFLFFILAFRMGREGMSNSRIGHRRRTSEELEYLVLSLPPASLWGPWRPLTMCKIDHSSVFFKNVHLSAVSKLPLLSGCLVLCLLWSFPLEFCPVPITSLLPGHCNFPLHCSPSGCILRLSCD